MFFVLGLQSFGGGIATFTMIHEQTVRRLRYISEEQFVQNWAMVQLAPGINLLALVILIGRRARGMKGAFAALIGLMAPSCALTMLIASVYTHLHTVPAAVAAINAAIPAIVAVGLLSCITMLRPMIKSVPNELDTTPRSQPVFACAMVIAAGAAVLSNRLPIPAVLILCGVAGAIEAVLSRLLAMRRSTS